MEWSKEAKEALKKVPFFVRKKVKAKVEEEASRHGARVVTIEHVRASKRRFLNRMEDEVKGYQVEACFGPTGCPNQAVKADGLSEKLERALGKMGLKDFLKEKVNGPLKFHHEFRVVIADCPNACSRPQIVDVGLIGASVPVITDEACSECNACVETCKEGAISLVDGRPIISETRCLYCRDCISACPTGTIEKERDGYRVLVGGKLGRHPRLAEDLGLIVPPEEVVKVVNEIVDFYKENSLDGERLGSLLERLGSEKIKKVLSIDLGQVNG